MNTEKSTIDLSRERLLMAIWVIKRRYPDMPEHEVDKHVCEIVPNSLRDVEVVNPQSFFLHPAIYKRRSKA